MHELSVEDMKAVSGGHVLPHPGTPPIVPRPPILDPYPKWAASSGL